MSFHISKTGVGGHIACGRTDAVNFRVEWDAAGNPLSHSITIREPQPAAKPDAMAHYTDEQRATIELHRAACASCDQNKGLTALTVKCAGCGCSGLSLLSGSCKLGKWEAQK